MAISADLAVYAGVAVVAFVLLEAMIRSSFVATVTLLIAVALSTTWEYLPQLYPGGMAVGPWDILGVLFTTAAIARLLRHHGISGPQWLLIAFGIVAFVSVAQGVGEFGLNTAVNEFRKYFWFVSVALYFSTVVPERTLLDRVARAWLLTAGYFVLLALLRWAVLPVGLTGGVFGTGDARVLVSSTTLFILQGFVIGALAWSTGGAARWIRRLTPALLAMVVLMQHRSVWAALLVVTAVMVFRDVQVRRRLVPMALLGVVVIASLSLTVLDDQSVDVPTQLAESAAYRVTWEWRVAGWQALIEHNGPRDMAEQLVGRPFGGGWDRVVDGYRTTVSPHNFYVETYLRMGFLGIGFFVALYVAVLWRLRRNGSSLGLLEGRTLFLLLLTQLIYFVPYSLDSAQGLFAGLAIATASMYPSRDRAPATPAFKQAP